ncbi:MAG: hypothetical protein IK118_02875 [Clostridia bacterium]|nr:hypothetical protein [Clostridia bacterium]MBR5427268.1 hypothetical protein [Clostridia bacterium]
MNDCGGCLNTVYLTEQECALLSLFAAYSFLPVGQKTEETFPTLLTERTDEDNALLLLKLKGLVDVDYEQPLSGFDYAPFGDYARLGSAALTAKGQDVLDAIEVNGVG